MRSMLRTGLVVALGVLAGRLAGFFREVSVASHFGVSLAADQAVLVLTIPDLLTGLLAGGALTLVLLPEFHRSEMTALGSSARLLRTSSLGALLVFGAIALTVAFLSAPLVRLLAPGFPEAGVLAVAPIVALAVIAIPVSGMTAVAAAFLHSRERFGVVASGTAVFNLAVIGCILLLAPSHGILAVAAGVVTGSFMRGAMHLVALSRRAPAGPAAALGPPIHAAAGEPDREPLVRRYAHALVATGVVLLLPVFGRAFASVVGVGGLSAFNYATKLVELPLGVAVGVVSIVLFPRLSRAFAGGDDASFTRTCRQGLWATFLLAVPMTVVLAWFAGPLATLVYARGALVPEAAAGIGSMAALGFLGLPALGATALLQAAFSARRDTATPSYASVAALLLFVPLAWLGTELAGMAGLMAALAGTQWVLAVSLLWLLRWRHGTLVVAGGLARDIMTIGAASLLLLAPIALLGTWLVEPVPAFFLASAGGAAMLGVLVFLPYRTVPSGRDLAAEVLPPKIAERVLRRATNTEKRGVEPHGR
jgi:putative peptidoglycan lipid II flippase